MRIIVPTDFSTVANNAALYALNMLNDKNNAQLILYHLYEKPSDAEEAAASMESLINELKPSSSLNIETRLEQGGDLIDSLHRLTRHMDASLIIMGITGKSRLKKVFLGSNTLKMVERNACPVLVIPPDARFSEVKNVALLSDFKEVETSVPGIPIKNVLGLFKPSLHIINVNSSHYVSLTTEFLEERKRMQDLFIDLKPEFYFIGTTDLHETAKQFVADKNIDMLVTVPRNHSFFGSMFKTSNTKRLVYESAIPILAAHE